MDDDDRTDLFIFALLAARPQRLLSRLTSDGASSNVLRHERSVSWLQSASSVQKGLSLSVKDASKQRRGATPSTRLNAVPKKVRDPFSSYSVSSDATSCMQLNTLEKDWTKVVGSASIWD